MKVIRREKDGVIFPWSKTGAEKPGFTVIENYDPEKAKAKAAAKPTEPAKASGLEK